TRANELRVEAVDVVTRRIYPAWKNAIEFLDKLVTKTTTDAGLWRLPGGPEAYAYFLRRFTTTDLTPDQIHDIGLREVASIEKEMDGILRQLGRTEGSVKDRVEKLKLDLGYPQTEEGRKLIMADVERILRDAEKRSQSLFDLRPKAAIVAQPFPRFREA